MIVLDEGSNKDDKGDILLNIRDNIVKLYFYVYNIDFFLISFLLTFLVNPLITIQ